MERIKFECKVDNEGIELRCRDSCPCHCTFSPVNNGALPLPNNFE